MWSVSYQRTEARPVLRRTSSHLSNSVSTGNETSCLKSNASGLYSRGLLLESRPRHRASLWRHFVVLFSSSMQILGQYLKLRSANFLPRSLFSNIQSLRGIQSEFTDRVVKGITSTSWKTEIRFPTRICLLAMTSRCAARGTQHPIRLGRGVNWPEGEDGHSTPSGSDVKNMWSYISTPPYAFVVCCLVKHKEFIFFLSFPQTKHVYSYFLHFISISSFPPHLPTNMTRQWANRQPNWLTKQKIFPIRVQNWITSSRQYLQILGL